MTAELFQLKDIRRERTEKSARLELITESGRERYVAQVMAGADPGLTAMAERVAERMSPPALEDVAIIDDRTPTESVYVIEPQRYRK